MGGTTIPEIDLRFTSADKVLNKLLYENFAILRNFLTPTPWVAPTLLNSWVNVGGANDEIAGYRKFGHTVELRGLLQSGTMADGTVLFTLPLGFRPTKVVKVAGVYVQVGIETLWQLEVQIDGDVAIYGVAGTTPQLSLSAILNLDNG